MVFINIQIGISRNYAQKLGFLFRYCMYSTGQEYMNKLVHVCTCASVFLFLESGHVYVHTHFFTLSLNTCVYMYICFSFP